VKIVAPAPAPALKAAAQLAASYASVREPSPLTPDPFSRASYALPVRSLLIKFSEKHMMRWFGA
jgi:hypothetical protein